MPDLPIVAEDENARGEHWYLNAAGSPADYYTMLETLHPDGRRDEGGMGGSPLYPGSRYNSYTGRADDGPLRVIVRTDPQVRRLPPQRPHHQGRDARPAAAGCGPRSRPGVLRDAAAAAGRAAVDPGFRR
jgi:hypothetical protein